MLLCVCVCVCVPFYASVCVCVGAMCVDMYSRVYLCWKEIRRKYSCLSVIVYDCQKRPGEMYCAHTQIHTDHNAAAMGPLGM